MVDSVVDSDATPYHAKQREEDVGRNPDFIVVFPVSDQRDDRGADSAKNDSNDVGHFRIPIFHLTYMHNLRGDLARTVRKHGP